MRKNGLSLAKLLAWDPVMVTIKAGEVALVPIEMGFGAGRYLATVALGATGKRGSGRTIGGWGGGSRGGVT